MLPMVKKLIKCEKSLKMEKIDFFGFFWKFYDFGQFWTPIAVYRFIEISFPQKAL
jgi:hypothetical protein